MPTAAVYARQSFFKEDSCSIDMQVERAKAFCISQGWDYIVYDIDKGYSGKDTDRPGFRQMMKDINAGKIQFVVVYKLDRVSRNLRDFFDLMEEFKQRDVGFRSLTENFDTTTPMGRAMLAIIAVFAQLERETTAERVRDNMLERARMGIWNGGPIPFGYRGDKTKIQVNGKEKAVSVLTVEETEAEYIRQFCDWYLQPKGSIRSNVMRANELAIPTKTGRVWNPNQMQRILNTPLHCIADEVAYEYFSNLDVEMACDKSDFDGVHGLMWYNRRKPHGRNSTRLRDKSEWVLTVGGHLGIIPGKQYVRIQDKLAANADRPARAGTGTKGLLAWLLKCGTCGRSMSYVDYKESDWQYYKCRGKESLGLCSGQSVKGHEIEEAVIQAIRKVCTDKAFLESIARQTLQTSQANTDPLENELKRLRTKLDALSAEQKELVKALGRRTLPEELIEERFQEIENEKTPLLKELNKVQEQLDQEQGTHIDMELVFGNLLRFNEVFDELEFEEKRTFLRSIIKEIKYDKGKMKIYLYFLPEISAGRPPSGGNDSGTSVLNGCPCSTKVPEHQFTLDTYIKKEYPEKTFGQRLRKARQEKGLMLKDVATQVGINELTLSGWERDIYKPMKFRTVIDIAELLGVSPEYLYGPLPEGSSIGDKLLYYRKCKGLTQKELARLLGVDQGTLGRVELNKKGKHRYITNKAREFASDFF